MQKAMFCIFLSALPGDLKAPNNFQFIKPNLCAPKLNYREMVSQPDPVIWFPTSNKIMFSTYKINTHGVLPVFSYSIHNKAFLQAAYVKFYNVYNVCNMELHWECAFQHV